MVILRWKSIPIDESFQNKSNESANEPFFNQRKKLERN